MTVGCLLCSNGKVEVPEGAPHARLPVCADCAAEAHRHNSVSVELRIGRLEREVRRLTSETIRLRTRLAKLKPEEGGTNDA